MDLVFDSLTSSITLAFFSIFFFYYLFLYSFSKVSHSKEAPIVEGAWPILGHLPLLRASLGPHKILGALADKYGPLFTIKLGSKHALILSNWEMAEECFTKTDLAVSSRPKLEATQHLAYNGAMFVLAPHDSYWREIRKIANSEFLSHSRVHQLQHFRVMAVKTSIKELYNVWCNKENKSSNYVLVDLKERFSQLSTNIVLPMLIGKRYFNATNMIDKEKSQNCIKALEEMMRLMGVFTVGDALPFLKWFDFGGHVKAMKKTFKELDKILGDLLEEHRHNRTLSETKEVDRDHQDFMDIMLSLVDGTTIEGFDSDTVIKATILTLIAGGVDATTVTLTWAICLSLNNPLVIEKAKEELDMQVGRERCVQESDIDKLMYIQAIVKETLRLYPPAPLASPREFSENCSLGGYDVKKGTRLIVNVWKIHTDSKVWLDPFEFKPERFLTTHKNVDVKGQHFELLPFGSGRRVCPGISFGLQIVHFALASFLHSFEMLNPSTEPIDMTEAFGITNSKANPLEILIKPRLSSNNYEVI